MTWSRYRSSASNESGISFPLLECWNPMTKAATIAAQVNGKRVMCRISLEVLKKRFRASEEEPMRAIVDNRASIEAAARRLIEKGAFEADGSIAIRQKDL
jgi:hypothetical protein